MRKRAVASARKLVLPLLLLSLAGNIVGIVWWLTHADDTAACACLSENSSGVEAASGMLL